MSLMRVQLKIWIDSVETEATTEMKVPESFEDLTPAELEKINVSAALRVVETLYEVLKQNVARVILAR